jgi:hypothetical protein
MDSSHGESIRVTERDISKEVSKTLQCINFDRNIWVRFGLPTNDQGVVDRELMKNLSGPPYVFSADRIVLKDSKHVDGVEFNNVNVIFMHAGRKNEKGNQPWVFSSFEDGYPVVETVNEVNKYLKSKNEKPVSIVMACNHYSDDSDIEIKIGDFPRDQVIVYAVGETVSLENATMSEDGKIFFEAKANEFWGLENLKVSESIKLSE